MILGFAYSAADFFLENASNATHAPCAIYSNRELIVSSAYGDCQGILSKKKPAA